MNRFKGYSNIWFLGLLLVTFLAGCGSNNSHTATDSKAITVYSLNGANGTIDESAKTISVTMPTGTKLTALIATYTTTGESVTVDSTPQTSAETPNNFTDPVEYTVTAVDSSTTIYTVTVTVALDGSKAITTYSLGTSTGVIASTGVIDESAKTILVTVPSGTPLTALVATYTTTGELVEALSDIDWVEQTTTSTPNDFTNPVTYRVTAADASTVEYIVTVTEAQPNDKAITTFSINGIDGIIDETSSPYTIEVTLRAETLLTGLVAKFSTTGTSVEVGTIVQESTITPNDFTDPIDYLVKDVEGLTTTYTVTVFLGPAGPAPVNLGTAGNFVILAKAAVSTTGTTAVVGDIGVSPAAATYITGFSLTADSTNVFSTSPLVTGSIFAANYTSPTPANMTTAISDMEIAFTDAAGRTLPDETELGDGNISSMTLAPGLYKWGTGVLITSAGVTLEGGAEDVWIFQIAGDLTVDNAAIVTLSGEAQAKNIFWQVSGQATLGTTVDFKGILLSQTLISFNTGAVMNGRVLAQTAVTLDATAITEPSSL